MSIKKLWKGSRVWLFIGLLFLIVLPLAFNSCGSNSYDVPPSQSTGALIEPSTLKEWIDAGRVNGSGYDKVVILDVTSSSALYLAAGGHITGAIYVDRNEFNAQRTEGLAPAANMLCAGAKMDEIIERAGIDKNTTIVFTSSATGSFLFPARAYFAFRYWGFPKEKLKFLNGYNKAFAVEFPAYMTAATPSITPSTYSVKNSGALRSDLRASIGEMIQAVGRADAQIVDTRSANAFNGTLASTSVTFTTPTGTTTTSAPVVFEGHINGAVNFPVSTDLLDALNNNKFKTAAQLNDLFTTTLGLSAGKRTYLYCTFGIISSSAFFVLDAILNWPVELYDGSWSQWGLYATTAAGGKLTIGTAWDMTLLSTPYYNTAPYADFTAAANYNAALAVTYFSDTAAEGANQIEIEDATYMGSGSTGGSTGGGGNAGC